MFDQENFLLQTPLPPHKMRGNGNPKDKFLSNHVVPTQALTNSNLSSFGRTNHKPPTLNEPIDFKNFRQWPR